MYQQLESNQRQIFQKVAEFESIFVSQVGMAENLAGVYDVVENTNTRIAHLTNEVQGAFTRFHQIILDEVQKRIPPVMAPNPVPGGNQPGLVRMRCTEVAVEGPPRPSSLAPAATSNLIPQLVRAGGLESSEIGGIENDRNRRETTVPVFPSMGSAGITPTMFAIPRSEPGENVATVAGIGLASENGAIRNTTAGQTYPVGFIANPVQAHMANRALQPKFTGIPGDTKPFAKILNFFRIARGNNRDR